MSNTSELKKVVKVVAKIAGVGEKVVEANSMPGKLGELVQAAPSLFPLLSINLAEAKTELAALDEQGRKDLIEELKADLQLDHKVVELGIEEAVELAEEGYEFVQKILAYAGKV